LDRGDPSSRYLTLAANVYARRLKRGDSHRVARTQSGGASVLEDHAFVMAGLLDLYQATGDPAWLSEIEGMDAVLAREFEDAAGGFYATAAGNDPRLVREKPFEDSALPSGNSVMALNLLRLAELTGKDEYRARADR